MYLVSVRPGEGNLSLPHWIDEWNTEDDSTQQNGNRTFHLRLLAESMMNVITEKSVIGVWVVDVNRGGS